MCPENRLKWQSLALAMMIVAAAVAPVRHNLMSSYLVCRPRASVTIDGLIHNAPYDLYLFGNNSHAGAGAGAKFHVNGTSQSTRGSGGPVFTKGGDYSEFQGVRADGDGALVIAVEASQGGLGIFNVITDPAISFVYDGKHSAELLSQWKSRRESRTLDIMEEVGTSAGAVRELGRPVSLSVKVSP